MKRFLLYLLSRIDRQTAAEWRGMIEAKNERPLNKAIEFAFAVIDSNGNERRFFMWKNAIDRPPIRELNYILRMSELEMGLNREDLATFMHDIQEQLSASKGSIDLGKVWKFTDMIQERIMLAPWEEHLYWAAAVEFFELTETLTDFVFQEQEAKIKLWKENGPSARFFTSGPIADKLRLAAQSEEDLAKMFTMQMLQMRSQEKRLKLLRDELES